MYGALTHTICMYVNMGVKTSMTEHVKMNYSSDPKYEPKLWKCDCCQVTIDTQNQVVWCPIYTALRAGKDLRCDLE